MKLHVLAVVIIVLSCAQEVSSRRRGGYNRRLLKAKIEELKAITTELKDDVNECKAEIQDLKGMVADILSLLGKKCPDGKEFNSCGSSCPPTCDPTPMACKAECVPGCFCSGDTVLHNNKCIPRSQCPPVQQCTDGKVYTTCGSACPPTCDQTPKFCTLQCLQGCFCPNGMVLHNDKCILPKDCP